jgi:LL-diaminopimelate aminotransferase
MISMSRRLASIGGYAFAEVDREVDRLRKEGREIIDFGVGDPTEPTPELIRKACKEGVEKRKSSGYPSYIGDLSYRQAVADWNRRRFGIRLDPETEISSNIGSKESVFNLPHAFINPGDNVLIPNPGYPPYSRGTLFAGGVSRYYNLTRDNNFLPDFDAFPKSVIRKSRILWLNYPNSPAGKIATREFYKEAVDFCHDNGILLVSDEAYSEIYFKEKPCSVLEVSKEGVLAINSLSKRSAMTGYRVGWVAGDENALAILKKLKTNVDSGTATFIQDAAAAALSDERHVDAFRAAYGKKMQVMVDAFKRAGLPDCTPEGTIYIWQRSSMSSIDFAKKLLQEGIATTPGSLFSEKVGGINPGEGYVRLALVPSIEKCKEAAGMISGMSFRG